MPFNAMIFVCVLITYLWKDIVLWLPGVAYGR
jgi:hypothetical protein